MSKLGSCITESRLGLTKHSRSRARKLGHARGNEGARAENYKNSANYVKFAQTIFVHYSAAYPTLTSSVFYISLAVVAVHDS